MDIVRDIPDRDNFVRTLYYLNDTHTDRNWRREIAPVSGLERPSSWPERDPLTRILAWMLHKNHFHLLVQEIREGGTAKLVQRLSGSLSMTFNLKYQEKGSLFQGSYRARTVSEDEHYRYLAFYIMVKNVLELYPGGLVAAQSHFDDAWEWAKRYPYSSLRDIVSGTQSPLLGDEEGLIRDIVGQGDSYKQEAKDLLDFHMAARRDDNLYSLSLEPW